MSDESTFYRQQGIPLGTASGFAHSHGDRLRIVFFGLNPEEYFSIPQEVTFVYESDELAAAANDVLQDRLERAADFHSAALANEFSIDNLLAFLNEHLDRNGILAVQWSGVVRLLSSGPECLLPSETWSSMHPEDLLDSNIEWHRRDSDAADGGMETLLHMQYGLTTDSMWVARTRISRSVTGFDFFGLGMPD